MRILVTGGTGVIGSNLVNQCLRSGHTVAYTFNSNEIRIPGAQAYEVDISDIKEIETITSQVRPDCIFHTAALTDVDSCEQHPEMADRINVAGTRNVCRAATSVEASVAFYSTACVFDGTESECTEGDDRNPINYYGRTKEQAEDIVREHPYGWYIFRTDQPYRWTEPWQTQTFPEWVHDRLTKGDDFPVFADWFNNPVLVRDLTASSLSLVQNRSREVFHLVGPDYISRFEWARIIAETFDFPLEMVKPGDSDSADLPANRPNANLSNAKAAAHDGVYLRSVSEGTAYLSEHYPAR